VENLVENAPPTISNQDQAGAFSMASTFLLKKKVEWRNSDFVSFRNTFVSDATA
jgi:hypothetical protein